MPRSASPIRAVAPALPRGADVSPRVAGRALRPIVVAAFLLVAAAPLAGQPAADAPRPGDAAEAGVRWFPDTTAFAPLLAAPLEIGLRGAFLLADRPDLEELSGAEPAEGGLLGDFEGRNIEAEVALGLRLPVALFQRERPGRPSVALEFESGVFSRFFMETAQKDLINVDFRVGAPLSLGYRGWEARLELRHLSSHLGDDFAERFGADLTRQFSEEGFELLVGRRLADRALRAYAGAEANFGISDEEDVARTSLRGGIEYDPGATRGEHTVWPFAAFDLQVDQLTDRVSGTAVAGAAFRVGSAGFRLESRAHFGPSTMGRLREWDETFWGVGLRIAPTRAF